MVLLVLTITRLLPKLRHDRFVPRTSIRKFEVKCSSRCMIPSKDRLFKRSCHHTRCKFRRCWAATRVVSPHTWPDDGPKCYVGIQLVNQSGDPPSSLPRFPRGFGSLAGNPAGIDFRPFVRLYCTRSLCGGRSRTFFDSLSSPFTWMNYGFCKHNNSVLRDPRSSWSSLKREM